MSLIDTTYFSKPGCNLPLSTHNTVQLHLDRYERDILIQILGNDLYKLVAAYSVSSEQRIKDIVVGKEYTEGDYTIKWNGLVNTEKVSILAYYAYIQYLTNYAVTFQNVGSVAANVENATVIGVGGLIQKAGAELKTLIGFPGQDAYAPSLFNFLMTYESVYPEWLFINYQSPNMFDL